MSLYSDLGLPEGAPSEDVIRAYRSRRSKLHPDREGGDTAKFQVIQHAYDILGDEAKRRRYDETGAEKEGPDPRAMAMEQLSGLFLQALEQAPEAGSKDLIATCRAAIEQGIREGHSQIATQQRRIAKTKDALRRLGKARNKRPNFLKNAIETTLKAQTEQLGGMNNLLTLGETMLEMLKDYSYTADAVTTTAGEFNTVGDILNSTVYRSL